MLFTAHLPLSLPETLLRHHKRSQNRIDGRRRQGAYPHFSLAGQSLLVGGFVVTGFAAVFAVHQAVGAKADVDHGLAKAAEFFAIASSFKLVALCAVVFGRTGFGAHAVNVARIGGLRKMTLVMAAVVETAIAATLPISV